MNIDYEMKKKMDDCGVAYLHYWLYLEYDPKLNSEVKDVVLQYLKAKNYPKALSFVDIERGYLSTSFIDQTSAFEYRDWLLENHKDKLIVLNYFSKHDSNVYLDFPKDQEDDESYIESK